MIPLIPIIIGALALLGGVAVIVVLVLVIETIIDWFKNRNAIKEKDKDNIAFTIQEKLKSGKYKTIQGIFNAREETLEDAVVYESEDIDKELREAHIDNELVIYE